MKKLIFILLVVASFKVAAQTNPNPNQIFYVVEWDDTVTVRDVDNIRPNMIKNWNYKTAIWPVNLSENVELFVFEGTKNMPLSDQRLFDLRLELYFLDSSNISLGYDSTRLCGYQWIETPSDTTNIFAAIDAIKSKYNNRIFNNEYGNYEDEIAQLQKQIENLAYYCYAIDAQINTLPTPSRLLNKIPKIRTFITKWFINNTHSDDIKQAIRNEESTDIDAGWVSE